MPIPEPTDPQVPPIDLSETDWLGDAQPNFEAFASGVSDQLWSIAQENWLWIEGLIVLLVALTIGPVVFNTLTGMKTWGVHGKNNSDESNPNQGQFRL